MWDLFVWLPVFLVVATAIGFWSLGFEFSCLFREIEFKLR